MASFEDSYHFHHATIQDADAINQLESQSYPADEAATYDKIVYRIKNANEYFYVLKKHNELVGFINGTCIMENTIHHESMSHHHPEGKYLVIHSVTVRKEARRQKIASKMLRAYVHKIADLRKVKGILLMSKSYLLPFYLQVGFNFVKVSPVVHGAEQWNELAMDLQDHFGVKEWVVDAFAARPFTGNPAAVVLIQRDDQWMQSVATENNYAETSFVQHLHDNHYSLRW
jgi:predicted GNAT family N-acyltransferase